MFHTGRRDTVEFGMRKFLLTLKYCGEDFVGWQVQKNGYSVQTCMQDAIEKIFGRRADVTGCSRTDSGVHALGYQMCFEMDTDMECRRIPLALNAVLPESISVWACTEVPASFHPRYSAKAKEYIYRLYDGPLRDPFLKGRAYHFKGNLDETRMREAAARFLGRHDFRSFMSDGSKITQTERTLYYFNIRRKERLLELCVCGDGFLYNMVRILTGTLIWVGTGRIDAADCDAILRAKNRKAAGPTVPAEGLYLSRVFYTLPTEEENYEPFK